MINRNTKSFVDNCIDKIKVRPITNEFDPVHNIRDWNAMERWCSNNTIPRPSYGREVWEVITSHIKSKEDQYRYWNYCWKGLYDNVSDAPYGWEFIFPSMYDLSNDVEIIGQLPPVPTEENFCNVDWYL